MPMENIIHFFRDILDGPLYVIVVIISILLLCVCIGYLIDVRQKRQHIYKEQEILIDKIQPEKLFKQTFVPDKLIASNVYQKQSKFGTKGSSKYKFHVRDLQEYLKYRGYDNN